jgi:hypothetical protein
MVLAEVDYSPIAEDQANLDAAYRLVFGDPVQPTERPQSAHTGSTTLSDFDIMQKASNAVNGPKFRALMGGATSDYPSASEADAALAAIIAFYTPDEAQIERLMRQSNLVRGKWDAPRPGGTYLSVTIDRALRTVREHYSPSYSTGGVRLGTTVPTSPTVSNWTQTEHPDLSTNVDIPPAEAAEAAEAMETIEPTAGGLIRLSDVRPERVSWLWHSRVPLGKLTIWDGDPGTGKTTAAIDLAARVTTHRPMPDGTPSDLLEPAGVVLLTAEDGLADTIRPRCDAAGADASRVACRQLILETTGVLRMPTLADLSQIEQDIAAVDARLVIIDPIMAYLPVGTKSHVDADVRRVLAPLADLAERTGAAIVALRHLNKTDGGNPLYRGGGSIAFTGAARSVLLAARDPDDETGARHVLAATKSNLGKKPPALAYHIEEADNGSSRIVWDGAARYTADELLASPDPEERGALADAIAFLRDLLTDGPCRAGDVKQKARQAGIAERTLHRAKERLKIRAERFGAVTDAHWEWRLPSD